MAIGIGQSLGNYRLKGLLGRGGFADVYLAEHIYLGTPVAIKVLSMQLTSDNIELFSKEARTVANLFHSHILRVLDFGIEHGIPYLVMDYARNGTLRQRHPKGSILQLETIVSYVKQIAPALQYIHERKLIHRDIKPENLLIGRDGEILISDFGIATVAHSTRSLNTEGASGTIYYMAPEQIQGRPRPASDQYALGVLVYEWLCGTPPFTGTVMEIGMQHLLTPPPPLHRKSTTISYPVEEVILTALAKDPHQRFENIQTFARVLEQASRVLLGTPLCVYTGYSGVSTYSEYYQREYKVSSALWSPDSKFVASVGWKEGVEPVHIWNAVDGVPSKIIRSNLSNIEAIVWKDNTLYAITLDKPDRLVQAKVELINSISEQRIVIYHDWMYSDDLVSTVWSPNGECIAFLLGHSVYDGSPDSWEDFGGGYYSYDRVEIRTAAIGEKIGEYFFRDPDVRDIPPIVWSADSLCIAIGLDQTIEIWEVNTQKVVSSYPALFSSVPIWSPDGNHIAIGYEAEVKILHALTGDEILTYINRSRIKMKSDRVTTFTLLPSSSKNSTEPYIPTKQLEMAVSPIYNYTPPPVYNYLEEPQVTAIAWSTDGKRIISAYHHGDYDSTVHIWNSMTGENVVTRHTQFGRIVNMDWSPDGRRIAVAFEIGHIEIWCAT